jgi:hypothetical protein
MFAVAQLLKSDLHFKATVYEKRDDFSRLSQLIAYPGLNIDKLLDEEALNELVTSGGHFHLVSDSDEELCTGFAAPTLVWQKVLKNYLERRGIKFKQGEVIPSDLTGQVDLVISARGSNSPDAQSSPNFGHKLGRQVGYIMQTIHRDEARLLKTPMREIPLERQEPPYTILYKNSENFRFKNGFTVATYNSVSVTFARRRDFFYSVTNDRSVEIIKDSSSDVDYSAITKPDLEKIIDAQIKRFKHKDANDFDSLEAIAKEIIRLEDLTNNLKIGDKLLFSECGVVLRRDGSLDPRCFEFFHSDFSALADRFIKHPRSLARPIEHKPLLRAGRKTEVSRLGDEIGTPHWATGRGFYGPVWQGKYIVLLARCIANAKKLEDIAHEDGIDVTLKNKLLEAAEQMRQQGRRIYEIAADDIVGQIEMTGMVMDLLPEYNDTHTVEESTDYRPG